MNNFIIKKLKLFLSLLAVIIIILLVSVCAAPGGGGGGGGGSGGGKKSATTYTLTIKKIGEGTVTPAEGTYIYAPGTVINLLAAETTNTFIQWQDGRADRDLTGETNLNAQVTMNSNKTITAFFVDPGTAVRHTLTINPPTNGNIQLSPNPISNPNPNQYEYYAGTEVTFTPAPTNGYKLASWSGDLSGSSNTASIMMNSNRSVSASFNEVIWTIMIHFAVDNNIDYDFEVRYGIISNYLKTLESIIANNTNRNIQICVMMDGVDDERFNDGYYVLTGGKFKDDLKLDIIGDINSGSPASTTAFMDWVINNYAGKKYLYSVFNHGSGFDDNNINGTYSLYGVGFDDSNNDCLSHHELGDVTAFLKNNIHAGESFELFYPYACLMGGVELAYEIKDNVKYLLFSEESFPADYWSYEALTNINSNSNISTLDLAEGFCDSAYNYFSSHKRGFTLSVIDLSTIDALATAINTFAPAAIADITDIEKGEDYLQLAYSSLSMLRNDAPDYYYVDLKDFMTNINNSSFASSAVKNAATSINTAINNSVVYTRQYDYSRATGMTIFHNVKFSFLGDYSTITYHDILTFGSSNSWVDYIQHLETTINNFSAADHYENDNTSANDNYLDYLAANNRPQYHTINTAGDVDWYSLLLSTSDNTVVGFISGNDCITGTVYTGTSAGPITNVGTFSDSTNAYLFPRENVYIWIQISSKGGVTGVYRASMFRWNDTILKNMKKQNIKFNKFNLK